MLKSKISVGDRFDKLEVLEDTQKRHRGCIVWLCKCDCGNTVEMISNNLKRNKNNHCGCVRKKSLNTYLNSINTFKEIKGEYYMYDVEGNRTLIDKEDIPKLQQYYWRKNTLGYWMYRNKLLLHRFIMNCPKDLLVDHINHNLDDHRKRSLRVVTHQQNQLNKKPKNRSIDLPTGVYKTPYGKYQAMLRLKNKKTLSKNFATVEEAIKQRQEWEDTYIKDYKYRVAR